jgi:vacuole membrane protein 1
MNIQNSNIYIAGCYIKNSIKNSIKNNYKFCKNYFNKFLIIIGFNMVLITISSTFYKFNLYLYYLFYWVILGILSTIGLGSGIPTGLFFLFPHVLNIKQISLECNNTNFDLVGSYKFECKTIDNIKPSNYNIFLKVLPATILWGFGTSLGEIPPYYLSKIANKNKIKHSNYLLQKYYDNSIFFINKYGFITILILSCWPSCTFDMCGLAAGYCNLNIYQFLLPTIIGKSLIKTPIQIYSILFLFDLNNIKFQNTYIIEYFFNLLFFLTTIYFCNKIIKDLANKQNNLNIIQL